MIIEKHPTYKKNRNKFFTRLTVLTILIVLIAYFFKWTNYPTIIITAVGIFVVLLLIYQPIASSRLKCPKCKEKLYLLPHEIDIHSKAVCDPCDITWDLEVAFLTKSDDHNDHHYDDFGCDD